MEQEFETITINGKKYYSHEQKEDIKGDIKIIVLQRGWVLVGKLVKDGTKCKLQNASVIRNWGTTKGLGELAEKGPQTSTKLDPCNGEVEFDILTMVLSISVKESVWKNAL